LHVTAARAPNDDLVGSRVVAVEHVPIADVLARLDPVVPRDNDSNLRAARLVYLTSAEVLSGLGIAGDATHIELEVEGSDGARRTALIAAIDASAYQEWIGGWELALPPGPDLLLLRDPERDFWIRYLGRTRSLYVRYNHVLPRSTDVVQAITSSLRGREVDRLVIDLRTNGGGEAEGYSDLLELLTGPAIDRPGRLYVLIGRLTFSAAASLVVELEHQARHVVFVGEATGGAPNFWADTVTVTLPYSRLKALVSETYEGYGASGDERLSISPDLPVALTWSDYAGGRDRALEAALTAPLEATG
jgi:hypothetical protein